MSFTVLGLESYNFIEVVKHLGVDLHRACIEQLIGYWMYGVSRNGELEVLLPFYWTFVMELFRGRKHIL